MIHSSETVEIRTIVQDERVPHCLAFAPRLATLSPRRAQDGPPRRSMAFAGATFTAAANREPMALNLAAPDSVDDLDLP